MPLSGVYSISGRPVSSDWVVIGDHSYYARYLAVGTWLAGEKIIIGKYCSIADNVAILTGGNRRTDRAANYPVLTLKEPANPAVLADARMANVRPHLLATLRALREVLPYLVPGATYRSTKNTTIGNDVWVGYGAMITGGAHVGDGAIVASGAVVFSDVPPYAVVAGNPAQVIRYRFSRPIVDSMLRIRWWDWADDVLRSRLEWFYRPINEFVERFDREGVASNGRADATAS